MQPWNEAFTISHTRDGDVTNCVPTKEFYHLLLHLLNEIFIVQEGPFQRYFLNYSQVRPETLQKCDLKL